jgi:UDP-2-acetamido-2,6-beta-L-arabino-hexul-4-ose reductase
MIEQAENRNVRVLVTGANGFIGKNLCLRLEEEGCYDVTTFCRGDRPQDLEDRIANAEIVVHLAGENRPSEESAFETGNVGLTQAICVAIGASPSPKQLILASSTQALRDNPYGRSKLAAEKFAEQLASTNEHAVVILRLPGVFGKWSKPDYNSVVATFCNNIANGLPIVIDNPDAPLSLIYIDDVVNDIISIIETPQAGLSYQQVGPVYSLSVGELATQIQAFADSRNSLTTERVGSGLVRALYSTYISYLPPTEFSYAIPSYVDTRGVFVEMLKTPDCGQFSYFTAHAGITRGCHYHHSKTEKFLVIKGEALFRFRHLQTGELVELSVSGAAPMIVDTIPGWVHDITNTGTDELVVMLWANEVFDRASPDTFSSKIQT